MKEIGGGEGRRRRKKGEKRAKTGMVPRRTSPLCVRLAEARDGGLEEGEGRRQTHKRTKKEQQKKRDRHRHCPRRTSPPGVGLAEPRDGGLVLRDVALELAPLLAHVRQRGPRGLELRAQERQLDGRVGFR